MTIRPFAALSKATTVAQVVATAFATAFAVAFPIALALGCGSTGSSRPSGPLAQTHPSDNLALPEAAKHLSIKRATQQSHTPSTNVTTSLALLADEARRIGAALAARDSSPLHHLAFEITDRTSVVIAATRGAIIESSHGRRRWLDVDLRVGSRNLDNTHQRSGSSYYQGAASVGIGETAELFGQTLHQSLRDSLWWETDQAYKSAAAEFIEAQAERRLRPVNDDDTADFSIETPVTYIEPPVLFELDHAWWEQRIRSLSSIFRDHNDVHESFVRLEVSTTNRRFVSIEGHRIHTARVHARLSFGAATTTADGAELSRYDSIDVNDMRRIPNEDTIRSRIETMIRQLRDLNKAPEAEPFVGPAILEGKAAAVFFHEVFGHRVEGHRQRGDIEGQTFLDQIGQQIMNPNFDVYDDPTVQSVNGIDLNGYYQVDSEGTRAVRANLISKGAFVGFLMSRMPVRGFENSNGHGRRDTGFRPVARQANLFVDATRVTSRADLERALLDEVRRQGKPYGFVIGEVVGGYTATQRGNPQAFVVEPAMVFRVYPDGRRELVRGVALEGTPLSALSNTIAAANDFAVFNGYCGAESGAVPVSAVSPSLLLRQIEITREQTERNMPPLLPAPRVHETRYTPRSNDLAVWQSKAAEASR